MSWPLLRSLYLACPLGLLVILPVAVAHMLGDSPSFNWIRSPVKLQEGWGPSERFKIGVTRIALSRTSAASGNLCIGSQHRSVWNKPRGSKYPLFKDSGPRFWNQRP